MLYVQGMSLLLFADITFENFGNFQGKHLKWICFIGKFANYSLQKTQTLRAIPKVPDVTLEG